MDAKIYFRVALVTVSLIILNQAFIQYWLFQKKEDSRTINVSGRQRMLSQRLVVLSYQYQKKPSNINKEKVQITNNLFQKKNIE